MRDFAPLELEPTQGALSEEGPPALASVELFDDFEQRRILASVSSALFDEEEELRIGRYRVESHIGSGGMGEVYLAIDEELGRRVAVKRVLARGGEREQERLRREAQALAALRSEQVVSVYEIGEHEGQLFVAMEYVEGETLADYLREPRSWEELLTRFLAAGRGLAAAHEAGLVHRDFKPENVLLGARGEVRVADFGLVLGADDDLPFERDEAPARAPFVSSARLSHTGAVLGTVRYMPFEQLRGAQVDARSDQFSFCVALYEALWGQPPFAIDSAWSRYEALELGVPTPPPRAHVPPGLWRVIRRGLALDPDRRWPTMNALLAALEAIPRRRQRRRWIAAAAMAGLVALGAWLLRPAPDPCGELERELAGTWDETARAQLSAKLPGERGEELRTALDAWAEPWMAERTQLCQAQQTQSLPLRDQQAQEDCLTRQRMRVAGLVELFAEAEPAELSRALAAVHQLPAPASCASELALLGVEPPNTSIAPEVARLRGELDRNQSWRELGRVERALARAHELVKQAEATDYAPLVAEARGELARAELQGGSLARSLDELALAIDLAESARHDRLAEALWTELALRLLGSMRDFEEGADALRRAEVASARAESPRPRLAAKRAYARSKLARGRGDTDEAEAELREALKRLGEAREDRAAQGDRAAYTSSLAALLEPRAPTAALAMHHEALILATAHYGPDHPQTAQLHFKLGEALRARGEAEAARAELGEAARVWNQAHEQPHTDLARVEQLLAESALAAGDLDGAEHHALRLAALQVQLLPPAHAERGASELLLAVIYSVQGDREAARQRAAAAVELWAPKLPAGHENLIRARLELAASLAAVGEHEDAAHQYRLVIANAGPPEADEAALGLVELELIAGELELAAEALAALDARLEAEGRELDEARFTHALLHALLLLRRDASDDEQRAAIEQLQTIESPFTPGQLAGWFSQLELSASERERLQL